MPRTAADPEQPLDSLNPQYLTDADGDRTAVVLSTEEFESVIEDHEDLFTIGERHAEPTIPHAEVVADLRRDGLIDAA